jgi:DNA topoisomerase IB
MALAWPETWQPPAAVEVAELVDPVESARAAGLRYVSDLTPGIRRRRIGKGFQYTASDGRPIREPESLRRIKRLAIPPAWSDVWIGNDEYRKENGSYGLTTLLNRHVNVLGSEVRFSFRGKSGKHHSIELHDRRTARIIKRFREIPGQELFKYVDDDGEAKAIDSADVNDYLREIAGEDFTAKDFRTWAGTILAARFLRDTAEVANARGLKKQLVRAIARVAEELGNTPAVAKKGYIHPAVIAAYLSGGLTPISEKDDPDPYRLSAEERSLLALLGNAS